MFKTINAVSNLIRTVLAVVITCAVGTFGWVGYRSYNSHQLALEEKDREIKESHAKIENLNRDLATKQQEIERLNTVVKLLKVDHRVAQIAVLEQGPSEDQKTVLTKFRFAEVDEGGHPIGEPQVFTVTGDVVYVDAWIVKFMDELVEEADPLRSTSICLFRRVFGEHQEPKDGYPLDTVGSRPAAYSHGSEISELERDIWSKFWDYANDPAKASKAGVRAAHGEAPSIKLMKGKLYKVELRASGGLSIVTEEIPPAVRGDAL